MDLKKNRTKFITEILTHREKRGNQNPNIEEGQTTQWPKKMDK